LKKIPIFPLPGVVFFPGTLLPLHIFEPRYRAMVEDVLTANGVIGMALAVTDGSDPASFHRDPPVRRLGGAGRIVEHERLEDGRYKIVLEGEFRYRIVSEEASGLYRVATVEEAPAAAFPSAGEERRFVAEISGLFEEVRPLVGVSPLPSGPLGAERLAAEIAVRLRLATEDLQSLLEADSLEERYYALIERLTRWKEIAGLLAPYRDETGDPQRN
jgi:Lon protease-like protein